MRKGVDDTYLAVSGARNRAASTLALPIIAKAGRPLSWYDATSGIPELELSSSQTLWKIAPSTPPKNRLQRDVLVLFERIDSLSTCPYLGANVPPTRPLAALMAVVRSFDTKRIKRYSVGMLLFKNRLFRVS